MDNEALLSAITEMISFQFRELEERLEQKLDEKLDEKLKPVYERLDRLESRMDAIESRMDALETDMKDVKSRLGVLEHDMKDVKKRLSNIEGAFYEEFHPLLVTHTLPRLRRVEHKLDEEVIPQLRATRSIADATYKLATSAMDWMSTMQADIDTLKNTVQQHSKLLA